MPYTYARAMEKNNEKFRNNNIFRNNYCYSGILRFMIKMLFIDGLLLLVSIIIITSAKEIVISEFFIIVF